MPHVHGFTKQAGSQVILADGSVGVVDANGNLSVASATSPALPAGFIPVLLSAKGYTSDDGTTQTLTTAMVAGADEMYHFSSGGATPTLTLPTAAAIIAATPNMSVGDSYLLHFLNSNSGTATIAAGSGAVIVGTATTASATWIKFRVAMTAVGAVTLQYLGKGVL